MTQKDQLIIIVLAAGLLLLLPKLAGLMKFQATNPNSGGSLAADGSGGGGGYYQNGEQYGVPWNLLQQTPNSGYVGLDPPEPEPEPDIITPAPDFKDEGTLWDIIIDGLAWGAGFVGAEEIIRRTVKKMGDLKPPKPPGGTSDPTPTPAPGITPTYTPNPHEAPGIWNPMYTEAATGAGLAAMATAAAYKLVNAPILTGLTAKAPTAAGAFIITPEMLGAPPGTNKARIDNYLNQWRTGINQAKTGHPLIGIQTALIGPDPWGKNTPAPQHHGGNISNSSPVYLPPDHHGTATNTTPTPANKEQVQITLNTKRTAAQIRGY